MRHDVHSYRLDYGPHKVSRFENWPSRKRKKKEIAYHWYKRFEYFVFLLFFFSCDIVGPAA